MLWSESVESVNRTHESSASLDKRTLIIFSLSDPTYTQAAAAYATSLEGGMDYIHSIFQWFGPRKLGKIPVRGPANRRLSGLFARKKYGMYFSGHLNPDVSQLAAVDSKVRRYGRVVIIGDSTPCSRQCSEVVTAILGRTTEYIEVRHDSLIHLITKEERSKTAFLPTKRAVLIVQPGWKACGSAATFDLVARVISSLGYLPVAIPIGLYGGKEQVHIGRNFSHQVSSGWEGIEISLFVGRWSRALRTFMWVVSSRRSLIDWICKQYSVAKISREARVLLSTLPVQDVYVNHVFTTDFAWRLKNKLRLNHARLILDTHDIQSLNMASQGALLPHLIKQPDFQANLESETRRISETDEVLFVSSAERSLFLNQSDISGKPSVPTRVAVPVPKARARIERVEPLLGPRQSLTLMANNDSNKLGLRWLIEEVSPHIHCERFQLLVVGDIKRSAEQWKDVPSWMHFLGRVDDVDLLYHQATSIVLPVVTGGGIAIKTLEALVAGVPIIGTSHALREIPAQSPLRGLDTGEEFALEIERVNRDSVYAERLIAAGCQTLELLSLSSYEVVLPQLFSSVDLGYQAAE